jgi:Fe-S-cluster containining protein
MNAPEYEAAASRLCAACGMCCDGTMFQIVRMQPADSPAELGRLGMKMRCRDGEFLMEQPCAGLRERRCTIYEKRPTRCRLFNCQQLGRVERGVATEAETMGLIVETRARVDAARALLVECGLREDGQALQERYERVMATPVDASLEPEMAVVRERLVREMEVLKGVLRREFMLRPGEG